MRFADQGEQAAMTRSDGLPVALC